MSPVAAAWSLLLVHLLAALCSAPVAGNVSVTLAGFFFNADGSSSEREEVFRQALTKISEEPPYKNYTYSYVVKRLSSLDSLPVSRQVCDDLRGSPLAAVFGPDQEPAAGHVQSICDAKAIPHVQTHQRDTTPNVLSSINLHPHPPVLRRAFAEILALNKWERFAVLYEDNAALLRLQGVLQMPRLKLEYQMMVHQLPVSDNYRHLLRQLMSAEVRHVVLDCGVKTVAKVLKQAQQVGMMTAEYSFFVTSLDLHTVDLVDFQYSGANITGLRLIKPSAQDYGTLQLRGRPLSTENALLYDAVLLFAKAFYELMDGLDREVPPLDCKSASKWMHGESLINYMRRTENRNGLTGHIKFDTERRRSWFSLDLLELAETGLERRGSWSPDGPSIAQRVRANNAQNQTIIITTILKDPYTMLKESSKRREGNDRFEGICVDIIDELAKELNFNYSFHLNPDDTPGRVDPVTKKWNGMIGELLDGKAHMAITDLTITKSRQEVVEFTLQWLSLGIGLLYTKPVKLPPNLFSFLSPLSLEVWIYIALAYLGVSVLMFLLARFTPFEWDHPHPCHLNQDLLENQFNFLNALWFCIGSLVQQGCDFLPKFSPYEWVNPHPCNDEPEELENEVNIRNGCWFTIGSLMQQGSDIAPK